jgi:hypothetical protein
VFVTSPADPHDTYNPMQFVNDNILQHPLQLSHEVNIYETSNSPSPSLVSPLDNPASMPLPPSPVSSIMMGSPHDVLHDPHFHPLKYEDMNTLGLGLSS